jgi:DNA-binding winged helix-turn-helix (wHTH) protein
LEKPGQLITRQQLRQRLWPPGTYVDFCRSLNTAVMKLRDTLGDSAENPRFVETLSRRGVSLHLSRRDRPRLDPADGARVRDDQYEQIPNSIFGKEWMKSRPVRITALRCRNQ